MFTVVKDCLMTVKQYVLLFMIIWHQQIVSGHARWNVS